MKDTDDFTDDLNRVSKERTSRKMFTRSQVSRDKRKSDPWHRRDGTAPGETESEPTSRAPSVLSIDQKRADPNDEQDYSNGRRNEESSVDPKGSDQVVADSDRGDSGD
jgi:hypothetical protein